MILGSILLRVLLNYIFFKKKFCSVFRLEGFAGVVQKVIQS